MDLDTALATKTTGPTGPLSCRLWHGATGTRGYPIMRVDGALRQVRRLVYERYKRPLLRGEMVVMECDQRLCVEPTHMCATPRLRQ